jgi:hypothetical protein
MRDLVIVRERDTGTALDCSCPPGQEHRSEFSEKSILAASRLPFSGPHGIYTNDVPFVMLNSALPPNTRCARVAHRYLAPGSIMAAILVVHGISNQYGGEMELHSATTLRPDRNDRYRRSEM